MEPDSRKVKILCRFAGAIHRRPADGALRYVGGSNHLLSLRRSSSFSDLSAKISGFFPPPFAVKYQLPGEDLDALVSISTPEDLDNMMEEFDRIDEISSNGSARIRLFVFSPADLGRYLVVDTGQEGYVDAINGGRGALACSAFVDLSRFGLSGESSQTRVSSGIGDRGVRFFNPHVNALNLLVESPKTDQDQKCTSQDSPSEANSNGNAVGYIDSINGGISVVGSSYQDSVESEIYKNLLTWRTDHQGAQFLNPNANAVVVHPVYLPGGNLNQSQRNVKCFPVESPKINHEEIPDQGGDHKCTDQEENPLWEVNKMKQMQDSSRILHQGAYFHNPNVNVVNVQGLVLSIPVENRKINQEEIPQGADRKRTTQEENLLSEGNTMKQTLDSLRICRQEMQLLNLNPNAVNVQGNMESFPVENQKTNQDEIPQRIDQKCTAQEENPLREVNETMIPTMIDHPGVQVLNPNGNPVGVRQGVQLLSPNVNAVNVCPVYVAGDNLNQIQGNVESFLLNNLCGGNSKTSQEEIPQITDQKCIAPEGNLLLEANETLIPPKIDHPGVQVPNQNGNTFGFCPVYVPIGSTAVNLNPKQGKVEPCLEENVYTISNQNYFYTNNGNVSHHRPLNQIAPLQPLYITPLPLSYVPPLRPGPDQMLRLDNCHMCQRELRHSHSDMLTNEQCNGNVPGSTTISDAAWTLLSHNSEDPMRLQAAPRVMTAAEPRIENYPYENQKTVYQSPSHAKVLHQPVMAGVLSESVRPQPHQRAATGGLVDIDAEPKVEITTVSCQPATYGVIQKPQDSESPVHKKVEARGDRSRFFSPPCTMGLSSETQLSYGVSVNHEIPPQLPHEESLQHLPLTSNKQFGFHGTSVVNANFPATEATSQVSVPEVSYDYARTINEIMDECHVSTFESTGFYEQQRPAVAVDVGMPRAPMSKNLLVVENSRAIGSKIGGNTVFVGNAFENPAMVPEGNSVRPIFQMQPGAEDLKPEQHQPLVAGNMTVKPHVGGSAAYLGNAFTSSGILHEPNPIKAIDHMPPSSMNSTRFLQPAETFHLPSFMDNHGPPFSYSQEMRVEPEVSIGCFHGMPTYTGGIGPVSGSKFNSNMIIKIPVGDRKDEASRSLLKDVINIPVPPSGDIPTQHLNYSCHTEHAEQFQGPIPSNSLLPNQGPHQILGSVQMASDKPSSKEFVAPLDFGSEKCQLSKVLPPTTNGSFDHPLNSMTNHSCLEPVHFPQGVEHNKQGSQAGADEQQMASLLQSSVPSVPIPLSLEKKESDQQSNKENGVVVGNASLQSAMKLGENKTEDIKTKQSDKMNLDADNIGHLQIIKNSDLEELQELGSGSFGTVYHGKWRGSDVAIKRISNRCFAGKPSEGERMRGDFWNEACKLADLHHPNVVAFYGVVLDGPEGSYATVTEFMANGSLRQALQRNNRSLDERKRLLIAMDVAFGMEYLHDKNIVHFDLKTDNLLVNLKDPQRPICKVADLGLSKVKRQTLVSGGVRGTLPWMAIELLNGSSCLVSEKVDVFSFGIVMWELHTGEEPYAEMHYGAIIGGIVNNTLRPPVPEFCDPDWRLLMEQCWSSDPSQRPSFTEIASRLRSMAGSPPKKDNLRH